MNAMDILNGQINGTLMDSDIEELNAELVECMRTTLLDHEQARNVGTYAELIPGPALIELWEALAEDCANHPNGQTTSTAWKNIRIIHPYIVRPVLMARGLL